MPKSNGHYGTPNTNEQVNGSTPGHLVYSFVKERHVCIRCRVRWVEANVLVCAVCEVAITGQKARKERKRKFPKLKDKNPREVQLVIARDLSGKGLSIMLTSDIGKLLGVHRLETVDIVDARHGVAKLSGFRDSDRKAGAA